MLSLPIEIPADVTETSSGYLDNLLNTDNMYYEEMDDQLYS